MRVGSRPTRTLLVVSALSLYLEMMLIRWIGTEIRIFAFLQNTILVACVLGLGMGCFTCRRPAQAGRALTPLAVLLALLAIPQTRDVLAHATASLSLIGDFVVWTRVVKLDPLDSVLVVAFGLITVYVVLVLVIDSFVPLGRIIGRLFDEDDDPIRAYSANILGGLVGIGLFAAVSALRQPPVVWCAVLAALVLLLLGTQRQWQARSIAIALALVPLAWLAERDPSVLGVFWSPYQKLGLQSMQPDDNGFVITVNGINYQMMTDLTPAHLAKAGRATPELPAGLTQYDVPVRLHPNPGKYLIVGAGSGNDVAGGLRGGAASIVAVEIDPVIVQLGRRLHPEQPYSSPKVTVVTDDARSFLTRTHERFDLITFGLLDSHTTTAMTNARLDSYVYTRESLVRAKSLLADGGVLVLSFEAERPFIADRMAEVIQDVFGEPPIVFRIPPSPLGWGGVFFVAGDLAAVRRTLVADQALGHFVSDLQRKYPVTLSGTTPVTTDDWPYTYLERRTIPALYYVLAGLMAVVWLRTRRRWQSGTTGRAWTRAHWHFFLLGAAFLLLEVQNVSKVSVALGNTWQVNAVVVSGVMVMALLANWCVRRLPRIPVLPVYGALVGACVVLYFVDLAAFAGWPYLEKAIVIGALTAIPMLFSGVIFAASFAQTAHRDEAFGANLVGALAGAALQPLSFLLGIKALLLIVAAFYIGSMIASRPWSVDHSLVTRAPITA